MFVRLLLLFALVVGSLTTLWTTPIPLGFQFEGEATVVFGVDYVHGVSFAIEDDMRAARRLMSRRALPEARLERAGPELSVTANHTGAVIEHFLARGYQLEGFEDGAHRLVLTEARRSLLRDELSDQVVGGLAARARACPEVRVERVSAERVAMTFPKELDLYRCLWSPLPANPPPPASHWQPRHGAPSWLPGGHDHCAPGVYAADPDHRNQRTLGRPPTC